MYHRCDQYYVNEITNELLLVIIMEKVINFSHLCGQVLQLFYVCTYDS